MNLLEFFFEIIIQRFICRFVGKRVRRVFFWVFGMNVALQKINEETWEQDLYNALVGIASIGYGVYYILSFVDFIGTI